MNKSVVVNFVIVFYSTKSTEAKSINFLVFLASKFLSYLYFILFQLRKNGNEIMFNITRYINIYIMYFVCSISCHSYTTFTKRDHASGKDNKACQIEIYASVSSRKLSTIIYYIVPLIPESYAGPYRANTAYIARLSAPNGIYEDLNEAWGAR